METEKVEQIRQILHEELRANIYGRVEGKQEAVERIEQEVGDEEEGVPEDEDWTAPYLGA